TPAIARRRHSGLDRMVPSTSERPLIGYYNHWKHDYIQNVQLKEYYIVHDDFLHANIQNIPDHCRSYAFCCVTSKRSKRHRHANAEDQGRVEQELAAAYEGRT